MGISGNNFCCLYENSAFYLEPVHSLKLLIFFFTFPTDAEYIVQDVIKSKTSNMRKLADDSPKQFGIYKFSDEGVAESGNLDGPSYCRICETVTSSYSGAFHHNSELQCYVLTDKYAISCPLCSASNFMSYETFKEHVQQHKVVFEYPTPAEEPIRRGKRNKIDTMIWMVQLLKTIIDVDGEDSKPFLPAMSPGLISLRKELVGLKICPWPICVILNNSKFQHDHDTSTDGITGRCKWCSNFHHATLDTGDKKACAKATFRGTLPM